jgi:hypothetical protein
MEASLMTSKLVFLGLALSLVACGGSSTEHQSGPSTGEGGTAGSSGGTTGGSAGHGGSGAGGSAGNAAAGGSTTTGGSGGSGAEGGAQAGTSGSGGSAGSAANGAVGGTASGATGGSAGKASGGSSGGGGASGHAGAGAGGMSGEGGDAGAGASGAAGTGNNTCGGLAAKMCGTDEVCHWANGSCGAGDQPGECILVGGGLCGVSSPVCGCDGKAYANACRAYGSGTDTTTDTTCARGNGAQGDSCLVDDDCTGGLKCCSLPIGLMQCTTPMGSTCPLTP